MPKRVNSSRFPHRGHALRHGRVSLPGQPYLVTTVTNERKPLFRDYDRACIMARTMNCSDPQLPCRSLAWVVMPDHVHWLLNTQEERSLSGIVRLLKGRVSRALNLYDRSPGRRVWQSGFHDHALRKEEDLQATARYIVANPLRAGLVADIGEYPFWNAVWL